MPVNSARAPGARLYRIYYYLRQRIRKLVPRRPRAGGAISETACGAGADAGARWACGVLVAHTRWAVEVGGVAQRQRNNNQHPGSVTRRPTQYHAFYIVSAPI